MTTDDPAETPIRLVLAAGAVLSVAITTYVGWHGSARVLIVPFALWVLAPFALLWWVQARSVQWHPPLRAAIFRVAAVVAAGSVAAYAIRLARPPRSQGAFVFVIVPPGAVLLIVLALSVAWARARRRHDAPR